MFRGRKSREASAEALPSLEAVAVEGANPEEDVTNEAGSPVVAQITNLEELVSKKTGELALAKEQLKQLSGTVGSSDEGGGESDAGDVTAQPHQPAAELVVEPEKKRESEAEDDSISSLFSQEEEEANPLAGLITSLPAIKAQELVEEVHELKLMVRELQQKIILAEKNKKTT